MSIYVEYLSVRTFLSSVLKELSPGGDNSTHYYIDATIQGKILANSLGKLFGFVFKKLEFEMRHIRDERGELVRLRIARKDLFEIRKNVIQSETYRSLSRDEWNQCRLPFYIEKGVGPFDFNNPHTDFIPIFIIQVIVWHMRKLGESQSKLLIKRRAWLGVYTQYALNYGVLLKGVSCKNTLRIDKKYIIEVLKKYPRLLIFLNNARYGTFRIRQSESNSTKPKLYFLGRGDVNLDNNGYHSDFVWLVNSEFPAGNILYEFHSEKEKMILEQNGIHAISGKIVNIPAYNIREMPLPNKNGNFKEESKRLKNLVISYNFIKTFWAHFFQTYSVRQLICAY